MGGDNIDDRRRARWGYVATATVVIAVLAVVGFRFVTAEAEPAPVAAPAVTLQAQAAELEGQVASSPQDTAAWQTLGTVYVRLANESGDPSFYDLAERAFDRADDVTPDDPLTLVGRGSLALALHDFELAQDLGKQAYDQLPRNAAVLAVLVDATVELGHYDQAIEHLDELVALRPDIAALSRVSYMRELHGDPGGAIAAMSAARSAGAGGSAFDTATVAALLGDLFMDTGDRPAAATAYTSALEISPGIVPADVGLARLEASEGDLAAAIERLQDVTANQPRPDALALLADLHGLTGDDRAAADADELVRTVATLQEAAGQQVDLEMALFEADRGDDPQRAVDLARQAYDARPDNIFAADVLGWALHRADRSDEAVEFVEQALRLGTEDPVLRYHAAAVYAAVDEPDIAREHLEAVMLTNPWFSFAHLAQAGQLAEELGLDEPPAWADR